jgi:hypothetical protein
LAPFQSGLAWKGWGGDAISFQAAAGLVKGRDNAHRGDEAPGGY